MTYRIFKAITRKIFIYGQHPYRHHRSVPFIVEIDFKYHTERHRAKNPGAKNTMRYYIALLPILFKNPLPLKLDEIMNRQPISINLTCIENPLCLFSSDYVRIQMDIRNETNKKINVPLQYLQKKGPWLSLVDTVTKNKITLRGGIADHALIEFTVIQPGESVRINTVVSPFEITSTRKYFVDLYLEAGISTEIKIDGVDGVTPFSGRASIRIIGKDTLEKIHHN